MAVGMAAASYIPSVIYLRHPSSFRALVLMMDGGLIGLALLPIGLWNVARYWAGNFSLYEDYSYVYLATCAVAFAALITNKRVAARVRRQMTTLREHSIEGAVTSGQLIHILVKQGNPQGVGSWSERAMTAAIAPASVGFLAIGAFGGRDYFLYAMFLVSCVIGPLFLAMVVVRRIAMRRYLKGQDVLIED